ncbi:MAG TPA: hypothetical protein VN684_12865 [Terriglobales bacterium]|nr:hypothetical protein [Terriglobales bacterium]
MSTSWPSATVTYKDTSGNSHTVNINNSDLATSTVASTQSLTDYNASGTALPTAAAYVTLINTNGSYTASGNTYPAWDPTDSSFFTALKGNGGHESGHGLGLGDQSVSGDIMSTWGWTASNPGGATNNKGGNAAYVITSCDANEVKSNPNAPYNSGGSSGGGGNSCQGPPPVMCTGNSSPSCTSGSWTCPGNSIGCTIPPPYEGGCYAFSCTGEVWQCTASSPIVIDTDGSGFHLTSAANGVSFDFFGDGSHIQIAWTAQGSTNGWLALDRNGNGVIDSAKELFGNITEQPISGDPNGFLALAVFDQPKEGGNGDGVIDDNDAIWPALRVWIDANHDGVSQPNELYTLEQVGISAINLKYTESRRTDQYGNVFRYKGRLVPVVPDTVRRVIYDVLLTNIDSAGKLNVAPTRSTPVSLWTEVLPDEITKAWTSRPRGQEHCAPIFNGISSQR